MLHLPARLAREEAPKLGNRIGNGMYKVAYAHPTDPNRVILRSNSTHAASTEQKFRDEIKMLNNLESWGMPVLQVFSLYIGMDDHLYMEVERHGAGRGDVAKANGWNAKPAAMFGMVNANTVKSIRQIVRAANAHMVTDVGDFQYLWSDEGRIIINDPHIHVGQASSREEWERTYKHGSLWYTQIRSFVEYVWAYKQGLTKAPAGYNDEALFAEYAWQHAKGWWDKNGIGIVKQQMVQQRAQEDLEAKAMAVLGIPTVNHHWVEIENS